MDRKGLLIGKKLKITGYLTEFTDPYLNDEDLKDLIINNISDNKVKKKKIKSKKAVSPRKQILHKKSTKKGREEPDFKISNIKSYYPPSKGAKLSCNR